MKRRQFLRLLTLVSATPALPWLGRGDASATPEFPRVHVPRFPWNEATFDQLQAAMQSGRISARNLVRAYRERIEAIDQRGPRLNAVIELNPDALGLATTLDEERRRGRVRGPLHGIPILLKDNIDTGDRMMTTAGSLALEGAGPARDAFLAARLREAGAVILGKTNLSEWANFRSPRSTSGWSGRGGQTHNPYVLDRNPSGSSSGSAVAVAANLCAAAVGTETDGSILSPSSFCGLVGVKPTVGLVSRRGIIPIAVSQDTAGPMARTVTDAALLLAAMAGADPEDPAASDSSRRPPVIDRRCLNPEALRGARVGVVRQHFGAHAETDRVIEGALQQIREAGATLVDPVTIPSIGKFGDTEFEVLLWEFKAGLNHYLTGRQPPPAVRSLEELIAFNERHADRELRWFGQEILTRAQAKGPLTEPAYLDALARNRRLTRAEGIDAIMDQHQLDALVAPTSGPAHVTDLLYGDRDTGGSTSLAAVAGYPSVTVPAGFVRELPIGISFFGRAFSESRLLGLAYGFEQRTRVRRPPGFLLTQPG